MKPISHTSMPHDATFRQFLKHPEIARDFMKLHLPAELQAICDFSTLTLENGSFVEENLKQYFSDVLYSMKTTDGGEGVIQVLIEHQSSPDKHMAFRMIRYAVAVMQSHLDAGHAQLPLVIPILFYTGKRSPYPTLAAPQRIALINYIIMAGDTADAEAYIHKLARRMPQHEDELMTIAHQLEQKGVEKGLEQGLEQGMQLGELHGIKKGKLAVARTMLQCGLDNKAVMNMTGLSAHDLLELSH